MVLPALRTLTNGEAGVASYYPERKTLNIVIPSAARNLAECVARCLAALGMTFDLFRSH